MGKEWLFWGGGGGKSTKRSIVAAADRKAAAPVGCMCAVLKLFDLHHFPFAFHHQSSLKPGSFLKDEPTLRKGLEAPRNSLELEEPFVETAACSSSSTMKLKQETLNIPVNIQIKTSCENKSPRLSTSKSRAENLLSECSSSSSPGAKTPTLVARLMGLEQLPESSTGPPSLSSSTYTPTLNSLTNSHLLPREQSQRRDHSPSRQYYLHSSRSCISHTSFYDNDITTTLSLPETPRISSSARRSDVERRLSLQINKENIGEEYEFSAFMANKLATRISESKQEDENRRGGHYARQIVKQFKESVSRKVGRDITNTINSREQSRKLALDIKPKKPSSSKLVLTRIGSESSQSKQSTPSCSPRLLDPPKNKPVTKTHETSYSPTLSPLSLSPKSQLKPNPQGSVLQKLQNRQQNSEVKKCMKDKTEKYNSHLRKPPRVSDTIRNKKEEPFIRTSKGSVTDNKCKKTLLSNELLNISAPTLLPLKKESFSQATKLGDKQASDAATWKRSTKLSSCSSQSYNQQLQHQDMTRTLTFRENILDRCNGSSNSTSASTGDEAVEYQYYIQRILKRTGIDKSTPVSLAKWYSPSHPLDPSIFHYIELFYPTKIIPISTSKNSKLNLKCNRRLVFQLVDELLAEILKPYLNERQCNRPPRGQMYGSELIEALCSRINKFPSVDCQVLEDIDALVDTDLRGKSSWVPACEGGEEEEGERIILEIEREIAEVLVHETAMEVANWLGPGPGHGQSVQCRTKV